MVFYSSASESDEYRKPALGTLSFLMREDQRGSAGSSQRRNKPDECSIRPEESTPYSLGGNGSKGTLARGGNKFSNCGVVDKLMSGSCESGLISSIAAFARYWVAGSGETNRYFAPVFFKRCTIASGAFLGEIMSAVKPARRHPTTEHAKVMVSAVSVSMDIHSE